MRRNRAVSFALATRFNAETNGFAFVNNWPFNEGETAKIHKVFMDSVDRISKVDPIVGQVLNLFGVRGSLVDLVSKSIPQNYGLCGGMAFGALDYYNAGMPIPIGGERPTYEDPAGKRLREYLVRRQMDSLARTCPRSSYGWRSFTWSCQPLFQERRAVAARTNQGAMEDPQEKS